MAVSKRTADFYIEFGKRGSRKTYAVGRTAERADIRITLKHSHFRFCLKIGGDGGGGGGGNREKERERVREIENFILQGL